MLATDAGLLIPAALVIFVWREFSTVAETGQTRTRRHAVAGHRTKNSVGQQALGVMEEKFRQLIFLKWWGTNHVVFQTRVKRNGDGHRRARGDRVVHDDDSVNVAYQLPLPVQARRDGQCHNVRAPATTTLEPKQDVAIHG
jgi:hypothetical protein